MFKNKIIILSFVLISIAGFSLLRIWPVKQRQAYEQKVVLAKEIKKVMGRLMIDLRNTTAASLKDVPADGQWHGRMAFVSAGEGAVEYTIAQGRLIRVSQGVKQEIAQHINRLKIRRYGQSPTLLEVQIEALNKSQLTSNFKLRLRS